MKERATEPSRAADTDRRIAELEQAVRARDDFIAVVAHELRNPLTPVVMRLERLLGAAQPDAGVPPDLAEDLKGLKDRLDRYIRRVTVLLDVSHLNSGRLQLDIAEVDLADVVREVVTRTAPIARFVGSDIDLRLEHGVFSLGDRLAVERVVENLVSNALKYGDSRPVDISLARNGPMARLTVRDHGSGISAEDRERMFGPFERAVARRPQGGFGVGLWITRQLVEAMGGAIDVASEPGQGSVFSIRLPLGRAHQETTAS